MRPRSPLPTGVLRWDLGALGLDVVRLLAGAVWAGLDRLGVADDAHSPDLMEKQLELWNFEIEVLQLTEMLLAASCLMGGVGVTVTPGGMIGVLVVMKPAWNIIDKEHES